MIPQDKPLVLHVVTGLADGGAEASLDRLCRADEAHRHHVVSLMDDGRYGAPLRRAGVTVTSLGMPRGRLRLHGVLELLRLLRRERPFVVQTWMYHADLIGGLTARAAGLRNVLWNIRHSDLDAQATRASTRLVARICAALSGRVPRRVICCAEAARLAHVALGYRSERLIVIPNGYDLSALAPDGAAGRSFRASLGISEETPLIGMVARLAAEKDHPNLLAALAAVRREGVSFHAVLIGRDMEQANAALSRMIAEHQLEDVVTPLGPRTDIPAVMSGLNLHVLASQSEGFPNVIGEAMACGTPCVTTDVGDAARIVGNTGWVAPPRDPGALAQAIIDALRELEDAGRWTARKTAARARIEEHFSLERMVKAYEDVWMETSLSTQPGFGKR